MKHRIVVAIVATLSIAASACGGDSSGLSADGFVGAIDDACRTLSKGIGKLDAPQSLRDVSSYSDDASQLFSDAIVTIKKLKASGASKSITSDAKDLLTNFEDQQSAIDDLGAAAKKADQAKVDKALATLGSLNNDANDLATSLEAKRCSLDPIGPALAPTPTTVAATVAPSTELATTVPAVTTPPVTQPQITLPVIATVPVTVTVPPTAAPPETASPAPSNKPVVPFASQLTPKGSYTFSDAPEGAVTLFQIFLDISTVLSPQPGQIGSVDVNEYGGITGRVFVFLADGTLAPGSVEDLIPLISAGSITIPATMAKVPGVTWSQDDGTTYFLAAYQGLIIWVVGNGATNTEAALQAVLDSLK